MVTQEDKREADDAMTGFGMLVAVAFLSLVIFGTMWDAGTQWARIPAISSACVVLVCFVRARQPARTLRAWRLQRAAEAAEKAAKE